MAKPRRDGKLDSGMASRQAMQKEGYIGSVDGLLAENLWWELLARAGF